MALLALLALALLLLAALYPRSGLPAMFAVGLLLFVPGALGEALAVDDEYPVPHSTWP